MSNLAEKACVPCQGGVPPLAKETQEQLLKELGGWSVVDNHHLFKEFKFKNFDQALKFLIEALLRSYQIADTRLHLPSFIRGLIEHLHANNHQLAKSIQALVEFLLPLFQALHAPFGALPALLGPLPALLGPLPANLRLGLLVQNELNSVLHVHLP